MSLRIHSKVSANARRQAGDTASEPTSSGEKIVKLIPAEALGLYGTGTAIIGAASADGDGMDKLGLGILAGACFILIILVRIMLTKEKPSDKPQWIGIGIAIISFLLWLLALGGDAGFSNVWGDREWMGALLALIWGTLVPVVYKGN